MKQTTNKQSERFTDMRGSGYSANCIELYNDRPYYCGMPINDLLKANQPIITI